MLVSNQKSDWEKSILCVAEGANVLLEIKYFIVIFCHACCMTVSFSIYSNSTSLRKWGKEDNLTFSDSIHVLDVSNFNSWQCGFHLRIRGGGLYFAHVNA